MLYIAEFYYLLGIFNFNFLTIFNLQLLRLILCNRQVNLVLSSPIMSLIN
jgi:hypothetical protein